jgi:hypothetical protein
VPRRRLRIANGAMPLVRPMADKHWGKARTEGIAPCQIPEYRRGKASPHIRRQSRCKGLLGQSYDSQALQLAVPQFALLLHQCPSPFRPLMVLLLLSGQRIAQSKQSRAQQHYVFQQKSPRPGKRWKAAETLFPSRQRKQKRQRRQESAYRE